MALTPMPVLDDKCFTTLKQMIHSCTGITIREERKAMLEGRLSRRLRDLELSEFDSYIKHVEADPNELEEFINRVTTNETYFYRTPRIWEYISETFLNQWQAENPNTVLRIWSAASSTGDEAHTAGILLQDYKDRNPGFDYRVTGTDIDSSVIQSATEGRYKGRSIQRFRNEKPELFARYMVGSDAEGYTVTRNIKSNISFTHLNLFNTGPVGQTYSLVLLRNVLIYFARDDIERVMQTVHDRLNPSGIVIIGESESLNNLSTDFITVAPTIYQRVDAIPRAKAA